MPKLAEGYAEGFLLGAKMRLLHAGTYRFGAPPQCIAAALATIEDRDELENLALRPLRVSIWEDLIAPASLVILPRTNGSPPAR